MRILVVDDNYVNRVQLKTLLGQYGDCDGAGSAQTALALFQEAHEENLPYTLITLDIDLGVSDGRDLLAQIRRWEMDNNVGKAGLEAIILMVTVKDSAPDVFSSFHKGCEGYLVKPVTPENLRAQLQKNNLLK